MTPSYIIKGGEAGRARLSVLSEAMAEATGSLLDRAGPWDSRRVLDAGCGGGDVSRELARRVGSSGRVVGVDADGTKIAAATAASADLPQLSFRTSDAISRGPDDPFDVIYVRFLLSHLTDPAGALATLRDRLRSGGLLVAEDVDFDGHFAEPAQLALDRYVAWYKEAARRRGANAILGRELPRLVAGAGFEIAHAGTVNPAALSGPIKQLAPLTLAAIADSVVEAGLASQEEVERTLIELQAAADDPAVFMSLPRVGQVIARRR